MAERLVYQIGIAKYQAQPVLQTHDDIVDDRRIETVARDGTVYEWSCDICGTVDELVALAKGRLAQTGRTLSADERRRFLNS